MQILVGALLYRADSGDYVVTVQGALAHCIKLELVGLILQGEPFALPPNLWPAA